MIELAVQMDHGRLLLLLLLLLLWLPKTIKFSSRLKLRKIAHLHIVIQ